MKYYESELESSNRNLDEKVVRELLDDVKKSIDKSLTELGKADEQKVYDEWP